MCRAHAGRIYPGFRLLVVNHPCRWLSFGDFNYFKGPLFRDVTDRGQESRFSCQNSHVLTRQEGSKPISNYFWVHSYLRTANKLRKKLGSEFFSKPWGGGYHPLPGVSEPSGESPCLVQ